jgi:cytochrome b561
MSQPRQHHRALVICHWLTAALILVSLAAGFLVIGATPNSAPAKVSMLRVHALLGVLVLVVIAVQYALRLAMERPVPATAGNKSLDRLAALTHRAFYLLVVLMALSGIGTLVASGAGPILFGATDASLPATFYDVAPRHAHGIIAEVLAVLVLLHIVGAAYHQLVLKDGLLRRMWFGRPSARRLAEVVRIDVAAAPVLDIAALREHP